VNEKRYKITENKWNCTERKKRKRRREGKRSQCSCQLVSLFALCNWCKVPCFGRLLSCKNAVREAQLSALQQVTENARHFRYCRCMQTQPTLHLPHQKDIIRHQTLKHQLVLCTDETGTTSSPHCLIITSGCPILAKNEYIIRHDKVCTHLHYSICKTLGIETTENWYSHIPKSVCEHEDIIVLWNRGVQTDREVLAHRLDMILNKKDKICLLINVLIPSDRNVVQKESEKKIKIQKSKYRNSANV
jgi:hypothetical protein